MVVLTSNEFKFLQALEILKNVYSFNRIQQGPGYDTISDALTSGMGFDASVLTEAINESEIFKIEEVRPGLYNVHFHEEKDEPPIQTVELQIVN